MSDEKYEPPNLAKFVALDPLYTTLAFRLDNLPDAKPEKRPEAMPIIRRLLYPAFPVDAYCTSCKQHSIFNADAVDERIQTVQIHSFEGGGSWNFYLVFRCSRNRAHDLVVALHVTTFGTQNYFKPKDVSVVATKIGMWPSLADLQEPFDKRVAKALGERGAVEFKRAIGLVSHGIGIGAFVYLRRIFETLVDEVADSATMRGVLDRDEYARSRMDEKILLLKNDLPPFLVEHRKWYSIVSKGLHELSEEECLEYFPLVRTAIEIILEQKAEALERAEREREAGIAIHQLDERLKGNAPPREE